MEKDIYVTTDNDYFNSADEAYFFVSKGKAKPLPEFTTPIIENALEQGLLREATDKEIEEYETEKEVEKYISTGVIQRGRTWDETLKNYWEYKEKVKESKTPTKKKKEDSVEKETTQTQTTQTPSSTSTSTATSTK